MNIVFHTSSKQGLKRITPNISTHGKLWVYATKDKVFSALFLGHYGGDFSCAIGREKSSRLPALVERFPGAIDLRYSSQSGSIYTLDARGFVKDQTTWQEEVISEREQTPLSEEVVEDAKIYLEKLADVGQLVIKRFPDKTSSIPQDDSDLIEKAVSWTLKDKDNRHLDFLRKHLPHLVNEVVKRLAASGHPEMHLNEKLGKKFNLQVKHAP